MKQSTVFAGMLAAVLAAGCGDIKTPRELELNRKREQIRERLTELQPLVGDYDGWLHVQDRNEQSRFELRVVLTGKPYDGINSPDEITAPTVTATALVYGSGADKETYVYFNFDRSDYDPATRRLVFYSTNPGGSLVAQVSPEGAISGSWAVSSKGVIGRFEARKTGMGGF